MPKNLNKGLLHNYVIGPNIYFAFKNDLLDLLNLKTLLKQSFISQNQLLFSHIRGFLARSIGAIFLLEAQD